MSDYKIVKESIGQQADGWGNLDAAITRLQARVKRLLDEGYSLGEFTATERWDLMQIMYKTALPQAVIDNKRALGFMGPREGSMGPREAHGAPAWAPPESAGGLGLRQRMGLVNPFEGGRRITSSSRPRRARRHSASRTRKAKPTRRSRSQK